MPSLTLAHAKELLHQGNSGLGSAHAAGPSSPGHPHDFCITLEAASPGKLKCGGAGWLLTYGFAATPFGRCLLAESPRGLCFLAFVDSPDGRAELADLKETWPQAQLQSDDTFASRLTARIFQPAAPTGKSSPLKAYAQGTPFQIQVWRALLQIPAGGLVSYGQLAALLDQPGAVRAVGTAVGKNPLAYLIPCHRVIRKTGALGNYRWGKARKQALLAWESSVSRHPGP